MRITFVLLLKYSVSKMCPVAIPAVLDRPLHIFFLGFYNHSLRCDIQLFYLRWFSLPLRSVSVIVSIARVVFGQSLRKIHFFLRGELQMR